MKKKRRMPGGGFMAAVCLFLLLSGPARAADNFFLYGNQGGENITEADAPVVVNSWFTAVDYFRDGPYKGRMLAATGKSVYIQSAEGSSSWVKVAKVDFTMDPTFVRISPSGGQVALGLGYMQDLLVFDTSVLAAGTPESPVDLIASDQVKKFYENFYDAAWAGETHLVINGGWWTEYGVSANSGVSALDIQNENNYAVPVCGTIPGASSGIAVDADNNLYFGIGYSQNRTGEIKVFPADSWWNGSDALGMELAYDGPESFVIAEQVLSSAYLGFDSEGNLHVGGGQFVENTGAELGFAALISHRLMEEAQARIADPEIAFQVLDETRGSYYRELSADPCGNDTATGILANGSAVTVLWNGTNTTCNQGGNDDWWIPGAQPVLTTYHVDSGRDADNDGVLDVADWSPNTRDPQNVDSDGDGYGNIIDADLNNDDTVNMIDYYLFRSRYGSNDPHADMNSDGTVNMIDYYLFRNTYGKNAPFYN